MDLGIKILNQVYHSRYVERLDANSSKIKLIDSIRILRGWELSFPGVIFSQ